jgi:hypothetical protein
VGVGQGGEPSYAEAAQLLDPLLVAAAVADRPLAADLRPGLVELGVDLGLEARGQEVDVDVEEAGKPEAAPERRDLGLLVGDVGGLDRLSRR